MTHHHSSHSSSNSTSVRVAIRSAMIFATLAYAIYSANDLIAKILMGRYDHHTLLTLGPGLACLCLLGWIAARHGLGILGGPGWRLHMARALTIMVNANLILYGLAHVNFATFYAIVFGSPLAVVILARFILKEAIGPYRMMASMIGFMGVLFVAGGNFESDPLPVMALLISLFLIAAGILLIRRAGAALPMPVNAFYTMLGVFLGGAPFYVFNPELPHTVPDAGLFLLGAVCSVAGTWLFSIAYTRTPATAIIAPLHYTQIIWGIIFGYFLFQEVPTPTTLIGAAIIIGSGLFIVYRELVHKPALVARLGLPTRILRWLRRGGRAVGPDDDRPM